MQTLTGAAADPTTTPQASCVVDLDTGNAANLNSPIQTILNFIGWVRQKMGRLDVANVWAARQTLNGGLDATVTGAPAVTGTSLVAGDGLHGIGAGPNAGCAGYGGGTAGPGGYFLGGNNGVGLSSTGGANAPGVWAAPGAGATTAIDSQGDIDLRGHKILGVATPTASGDVTTKGYVDSAAPWVAWKAAPTVNFGTIGAAVTTSFDVAATGARPNDVVLMPRWADSDLLFNASVFGNDNVRIYVKNTSAGAGAAIGSQTFPMFGLR